MKKLSEALTDDGRLKVELVPMVTGDNPWRTRADYIQEQRRDTIRFWITISTLIISIISVALTSIVAIYTIKRVGNSESRQIAPIAQSVPKDSNE